MGPSTFNYAGLSTESDEDIEASIINDKHEQPDVQKKWSRFLIAGVTISMILTMVNTFLLTRVSLSQPNPWASADRLAGALLPRPNQFVGLDKVNRNRPGFSTPRPFMNRVSLLTQVSSEHSDYVYPDGQREWFSYTGTVSPLYKPFVVNKTTSTIAQFRALDFGMEWCQVTAKVSPQSVLDTETDPRPGFDRTFTSLGTEPVTIAVYELLTDKPLDVRSLSWATKPQRGQLLGTLLVGEGMGSELQTFRCPQDSLHTFEFACDAEFEEACAAEWWQDEHESLGIFLRQSSSLPQWEGV